MKIIKLEKLIIQILEDNWETTNHIWKYKIVNLFNKIILKQKYITGVSNILNNGLNSCLQSIVPAESWK